MSVTASRIEIAISCSRCQPVIRITAWGGVNSPGWLSIWLRVLSQIW
jgi:hypothetical protein